VQLLGRDIRRSAVRHYLGRVFATCASRTLRLPVYDTQCGAKMFRVSPRMLTVFSRPFLSRWVFDVEILARMVRGGLCDRRSNDDVPVCELPLRAWRDVQGSKLRGRDFVRAAWELLQIYRKYGRVRPRSPSELAPLPATDETPAQDQSTNVA
jgi:hypothetical protein